MAEGVRSLLAFWVGGAANPPTAPTQPGVRSLLAYWAGGALSIGEAPPPSTALAEIYGGTIISRLLREKQKKKQPPPLDIMVQLIARTDGGKESLIAALPKRQQQALPDPQVALVEDLVQRIEAASNAVRERVRRIYQERVALEEEDEDDELFLLTYQ